MQIKDQGAYISVTDSIIRDSDIGSDVSIPPFHEILYTLKMNASRGRSK
jgi:hypothetical protein